jgi:hypothetical protein
MGAMHRNGFHLRGAWSPPRAGMPVPVTVPRKTD